MKKITSVALALTIFAQGAFAQNKRNVSDELTFKIEKELSRAELILTEIDSLQEQLTQLKIKNERARSIRNVSLVVGAVSIGGALAFGGKSNGDLVDMIALAAKIVGYGVGAGAVLVTGGSQVYIHFKSDKIDEINSALNKAKAELIEEMAKNQATLDAVK